MSRSYGTRRTRKAATQKPPTAAGLLAERMPNKREVVVGICSLVVLYLANGDHARFVCHLFTCFPAALHNIHMLRGEVTPEQMNFTLLYWAVQSILVVADSVMNDLAGYYVAKFVVLTIMLAHATRISGDCEDDEVKAKLPDSRSRSTAVTRTNTLMSETFVAPTKKTINTGEFVANTTVSSSGAESSDSDSGTFMSTAQPFTSHGFVMSTSTCDPSMSDVDLTMTLGKTTQSIPPPRNDLITTPGDTLTFAWPNRQQSVLYVTNHSGKRVMWAIKTNSRKRIGASPSFGILPIGGYLQIRVAVDLQDASHAAKGDRMSIDYIFIDDIKKDALEFDQNLFLDDRIERERKCFTICYE